MMDQRLDMTATAGGALAAPRERLVLPVQGMTCASCVTHVEKALARIAGVERVAVNLATESAAVEGRALSLQALTHAVDAAQITALARELFPAERLSAAAVGREETRFREALASFSPQTSAA